MPTNKVTMRQIRETLRLHLQAGLSYNEVGRGLKICKSEVGKSASLARVAGVDWELAQTLSDEELEARLYRPVLPRGSHSVDPKKKELVVVTGFHHARSTLSPYVLPLSRPRLAERVDAWRAKNCPCDAFPAIREILGFATEDGGTDQLRYLRCAQFRALETHWYLRLVLETPRVPDLYAKLFPSKKDRRVAMARGAAWAGMPRG